MNFSILTLFIAFSIIFYSCRKSEYLLKNTEFIRDNGAGTGSVTWKSDKTYFIDGLVFVNDGQTLIIEPGTVIKGTLSSRTFTSALVVARGGKIIAEGRPDNPIIFTSEQDDPVSTLGFDKKGLWGGIIILGSAPINSQGGETFIEGIPLSEPRGVYGGNLEDDNSGIFRYVSIRHAGIDIGEENEINGLTLGGVGRRTRIDHVEVISSADDGYEFFGGTVSCKNLVAAFCRDDAFDFDEGYSGKLQFILGIKDSDDGDCLAEHSDFPNPSPSKPISYPTIYNATFIGNNSHQSPLVRFFGNGAGIYRNSIFLKNGKGIEIEYKPGISSYNQFVEEKIIIGNNIFYNVSGNHTDSIFSFYPGIYDPGNRIDALTEHFLDNENFIADPGFSVNGYPINILPASTQFDYMAPYNSPWFDEVSFKGAFGSNNWLEGWSILWSKNIIR